MDPRLLPRCEALRFKVKNITDDNQVMARLGKYNFRDTTLPGMYTSELPDTNHSVHSRWKTGDDLLTTVTIRWTS